MMIQPEGIIDDDEYLLLQTLGPSGAMSPSQISAQTLIPPSKTLSLLKSLADAGLVVIREDADSADGKLVALTAPARDLVEIMRERQSVRQMK
jgi:DNA-binding MarR family transcriptional regulator